MPHSLMLLDLFFLFFYIFDLFVKDSLPKPATLSSVSSPPPPMFCFKFHGALGDA